MLLLSSGVDVSLYPFLNPGVSALCRRYLEETFLRTGRGLKGRWGAFSQLFGGTDPTVIGVDNRPALTTNNFRFFALPIRRVFDKEISFETIHLEEDIAPHIRPTVLFRDGCLAGVSTLAFKL
jgi:hypothetical protein